MKRNLFGVGAVVALTIALFQGPRVDSAEQVAAMSVKGGADCKFKGFSADKPCTAITGCTHGNYKLAVEGGTDYRQKGIISKPNGNCEGNSQCETPRTYQLTIKDCAGG
ncbi:hypothetical protein Pan241w_35000 [Gimesia alba]|uniref:Uncharacterized protein n=1 Tax=Gimesia alba TaxID=2527973 RepID=A0A517RHR1_9PLAN|nr:hypothetical protein [Gimesia alba]QDT43400.1 hypothetical protein Pan241w_35000 [Gimesia alba]